MKATKGAPTPEMVDREEMISRRSFLRMGVAGTSAAALLFLAGFDGEEDGGNEGGEEEG